MLTMRTLAYATKTMTFNNSLKAFPFGCAYYINIRCVIQKIHSKDVAEFILSIKILELGQVSLWCYTRFFEMTSFRLRRVLFFFLLKAQLNCLIAVILYGFDLRNHTRTYFDNSAWKILSLGTEYGCHSDFLS